MHTLIDDEREMAVKDGRNDTKMAMKDRGKDISMEDLSWWVLKRKDGLGYARVCQGYATKGYMY